MWFKKRANFADSAESFKRLKNFIERPAVLRRDGGKKREGTVGRKVCQSGKVRRGRKFEI